MIIPLSKKIRIRGTADCWQLERSRLVKEQTRWTPFKYFSNLGQAVSAAGQREIRVHPGQRQLFFFLTTIRSFVFES